MGLEGEDGALLFGDPIPPAPGATKNKANGGTSTTNFYSGEGNSAVVGDNNLWDDLEYYDNSSTGKTTTTTTADVKTETSSSTSSGSTVTPDQGSLTENTATQTTEEDDSSSEQAREDIVVEKKVVQVPDESKVTAEYQAASKNQWLILVAGAVVALLLIVAVVMAIRFFRNREKAVKEEVAQTKFKSETAEIEPQFVLAADDSKNIFGNARLSIDDAIEEADEKKITSRKKKVKKVVVRKLTKKDGTAPDPVEEEKGEGSDIDDGFRNHGEMMSPNASLRSPDVNSSGSRFFNTQSRDSHAKMLGTSEGTAIKLRRLELEQQQN